MRLFKFALLLTFFITSSATNLQFQLSGDNGQFSSPNYPANYPVNMSCRWTINTAPGTRILLNFTHFQVERNKKCLYDYLLIKETRNGWGTLSSKYCGAMPVPDYLSQQNYLHIYFVSDRLGNVDKGFLITWKATDKDGNPLNKDLPSISPTASTKTCTTVTVTKSTMPCPKVLPTNVITGLPATKCKCDNQKTVFKTVTRYKINGGVRPTPSLNGGKTLSSSSRNAVPRNGSGCSNSAEYNNKAARSSTTNRNIVIAFGCLLFVLIVANIILVAVICRRDSTGYSLYSMKTCLPRKTAKARSVEHFYSSGPRPTLRMVDGDIVVVSTNGKVIRQQAPGDQTTLETSDNSHVQVQVTPQTECRSRSSERMPPEIPFHLVPPPDHQSSTLGSGDTHGLTDSNHDSSLSDPESDYY
ncbi:uncharacterized protein LOC135689240 isoform X2 [Rhopilema esculentum]|uniref:uncharacterized protein LOC135689240 isoform X2 n=1 Tax=Rhopilema esculentum TaxID=499914 RepID=UPI0031CE9D32